MSGWRSGALLSIAALGLFATPAIAQKDETQSGGEDGNAPVQDIEEVVVRGAREGDPLDLDLNYEQMLQTKVFSELRQVREEQERAAFRKKLPKSVKTGRVRWGYDPAAELRIRRESDLIELNEIDGAPPHAPTQFRFEF